MLRKYCFTCAESGVHVFETDKRGTELVRCDTCGTTRLRNPVEPLAGPRSSRRFRGKRERAEQ